MTASASDGWQNTFQQWESPTPQEAAAVNPLSTANQPPSLSQRASQPETSQQQTATPLNAGFASPPPTPERRMSLTPNTVVESGSVAMPGMPPAMIDAAVQRIASGVLEKLSDGPFIERFLKSQELTNDNRVLATQVQQLMRDSAQLQQEVQAAQQYAASFKRIVGNIFLKLD